MGGKTKTEKEGRNSTIITNSEGRKTENEEIDHQKTYRKK